MIAYNFHKSKGILFLNFLTPLRTAYESEFKFKFAVRNFRFEMMANKKVCSFQVNLIFFSQLPIRRFQIPYFFRVFYIVTS